MLVGVPEGPRTTNTASASCRRTVRNMPMPSLAAPSWFMKVKEPLAAERRKLHQRQVLFAYLHLTPDRE